ncbi:hypothetical protein SESBI_45242 [Sesbania bispinosa]|nr:hypothetical protein SESBI_45242 [Sesbania bispinosa]
MRSCPLPPREADDEPSNPDQAANENNQRKGKGKGKQLEGGSTSYAPDNVVKVVKEKGKGKKKLLRGPLLLHLIQAVKEKGKGKKNAQGSTSADVADTNVKAKQKKTTGNASKSVAKPNTTSSGQQTIAPNSRFCTKAHCGTIVGTNDVAATQNYQVDPKNGDVGGQN